MPYRRSVLARMARQEPRRPQLMRIAVVLRLVARQRHQPGLGLSRDRWLLARSRTIVEARQRTVGQRPLDTALHRLMMGPSLWPTAQNEGLSRYASSICPRDIRLVSSILDRESVVKVAISSSLIPNSTLAAILP